MSSSRFTFLTLIVIVAIAGMSQGLTLPLLAILLEERGVSSITNGMNAAALYIGMSLGVIFTLVNYAETAARFGIKEYVIKSGRFKDIGSPVRPLSEEERSIFQRLVNESYENFVTVISQGRRMSRERVREIADGRVYSGRQAKDLGLIDEFGDLDAATDYALARTGEQEATVVRYSEAFSWGNLLFSMQKRWASDDPFGLQRIFDQEAAPKLLYQYLPR